MRAEFRSLGFAGPVPILSKDECGALLTRLRQCDDPPIWFKGHGASSPAFLAAAQHPRLLGALSVLLGPDVMLWGASLVTREPGQSHRWHTDIESSAPSSRTVSVWLGLDGTSRRSSLQVASGSHRFGRPLQEVYARAGKRRGDVTRDDVLEWALEHDPRSGIVEPDLQDGDALFFDGRLWHGSRNTDGEQTRTCLLLRGRDPRHADPDSGPDRARVAVPSAGRRHASVRGLLTGNAEDTPNDLVTASAAVATGAAAGPLLRNRVDRLGLPLPEDDIVGWKPHLAFKGATRGLALLTCHTSVLSPGRDAARHPHPRRGRDPDRAGRRRGDPHPRQRRGSVAAQDDARRRRLLSGVLPPHHQQPGHAAGHLSHAEMGAVESHGWRVGDGPGLLAAVARPGAGPRLRLHAAVRGTHTSSAQAALPSDDAPAGCVIRAS